MILQVFVLALLNFTFSFCALSCTPDRLPDETLELIFSAGSFKDIYALVLVSKRFRLLVPRFYYNYFEQFCIDYTCGLLSFSEESLDLAKTPWAAIGLDEDVTLTTEHKIINTAFLMMYAGNTESLSLKIRSRLFRYIDTEQRRLLFKDALHGMLIHVYAGVQWEFSALSVNFTDFNPYLYHSYHLPLLELGCHPRSDEVLLKMIAVIVHFDGGIIDPNQVVRIGEMTEHPIYEAAKLTLQGSFIEEDRMLELCLRVIDAVYFFYGPDKSEAIVIRINEILSEEYQIEYDEYTFQTRIHDDPGNIYRLLITLEMIAIVPDGLIARLQHPLVLPSFLPFSLLLQKIVHGHYIDLKDFTSLMVESFRCFLRLPVHRQYRAYMSHAIWETEDSFTIGLLLSCSPVCYASDFFKRATAKKGKVVLPLAFAEAHWPLIYRIAFTYSDVLTYIVEWIAFDLSIMITLRDPAPILAYTDLPTKSFAFKQIFSFSCQYLIMNHRFTEDEVWTLRSLFPDKSNHFIIR